MIQTLENSYRTGTFDHFRIKLRIINTGPVPLSVDIVAPNTQGILSPASILPLPGNHIYDFIFAILPGFTTGAHSFDFEYVNDRRNCIQSHTINFTLPVARPADTNQDKDTNRLSVAPNPAAHSTTVQFEYALDEGERTLELYDLAGRLLERHAPNGPKGNWILDVSHLTAGQYLVVMKQHNTVLQQQRVLISH